MITTKSIFLKLNGRSFRYSTLRRELDQILVENIDRIPPDISARELLREAGSQNWIVEDAGGRLKVDMPRRLRVRMPSRARLVTR